MKSYSKTMLIILSVVIISSVVSVGSTNLTPEEEQLLHKHFVEGYTSPQDLPLILERYRRELRIDPENALKRSFDDSLKRRMAREVHEILEFLENPAMARVEGKAVIVTTDFFYGANILRGQLGERPLRTLAATVLGILIVLSLVAILATRLAPIIVQRSKVNCYSERRLTISSVVSVGVFLLVSLVSQNGVFGILAAFFSFVILIPKVILQIPKVLWQFTLNRIGELSKAIQSKE